MILLPPPLAYFAAALFGLVFGSFLNVCIVRLPRHESIVKPRSRCPECGKLICWYDNVPVLSYLALRAKCRGCRKRISALYPAVEVLTGLVFVGGLAEFGLTREFLKALIFAALMIVVIFTDLRERIIPHSVTLFGIACGLLLSFWVPVNDGLLEWVFQRSGMEFRGPLSSFTGAVLGGLFGAGLLYAVAWFFRRFGDPEKEYLGFGDVMLMLMVGVFLGIPLTYVTILLGSLAGMLVAGPVALLSRRFRQYPWPYGSFLGAAAIYAYFAGHELILSYLHWSGLV